MQKFKHALLLGEMLLVTSITLQKQLVKLRNQTASEKQKVLQQNVATHWNSTYYILNSLLPNRAGISSVLHNKDFTKPETERELEIKNEHWVLMEKTL